MDFSILYRVIWKPNAVFKQFVGKPRLEPFVLIGVIVVLSGINAYAGHFEDIIAHPVLLIVGLLQGFLLSLLFPVVNATIVSLIVRFTSKGRSSFVSLVSAFILCGLPYYIETILTATFGYAPIGMGSFFRPLETTQPFLFGVLATITPFFVWIIILWWAAINQLLNLQRRQSMLLVGSLVFINMFLGGIWGYLMSMITK